MKNLVIKLVLVSSFLLPLPVMASGTRRISSSDAQGLNGKTIELLIHKGYELTVDFLGLGETIVDVSPGDPSNFAFAGMVGKICPSFIQVPCEGNGAKILKIKQIKSIEFEHITSSSDGSTTLSIATQGVAGYQVYKFILKKGQGKPSFNHVSVTPEPQKPPLALSGDSLSSEELERSKDRDKRLLCENNNNTAGEQCER